VSAPPNGEKLLELILHELHDLRKQVTQTSADMAVLCQQVKDRSLGCPFREEIAESKRVSDRFTQFEDDYIKWRLEIANEARSEGGRAGAKAGGIFAIAMGLVGIAYELVKMLN